jgi:hypothetical protein
LLQGFCFDWRQLYALRGESAFGSVEYRELRDNLRASSLQLADGLVMRTNQVAAHSVLEGRVLRHLLHETAYGEARPVSIAAATGSDRQAAVRPRLTRPVFIVAAPRSGSTVLFETLALSRELWSLEGEAHWLVERLPELQPGAPHVDSNRLEARHVTEDIARQIDAGFFEHLRDADGRPLATGGGEVRFLEKTPKNSLRIPFFDRLYPDARFIFLWRDPLESLSSIMEAWRSGRWTTYRRLDGRDGPWSLLLPPGWRALRGKPLEEIAAFQWESANRIALDDLQSLPRHRWTSCRYSDLVTHPLATVRRLCNFAEVEFEGALRQRASAPLPLSRYTQTPPDTSKWRRNEVEIRRVLPAIEATWRRLQAL